MKIVNIHIPKTTGVSFSHSLKVLNLNVNNKNKFYSVDDVLLKKIIDFHDEDYSLYNEILKISNNRKNDY
jgi:hypothetical protein